MSASCEICKTKNVISFELNYVLGSFENSIFLELCPEDAELFRKVIKLIPHDVVGPLDRVDFSKKCVVTYPTTGRCLDDGDRGDQLCRNHKQLILDDINLNGSTTFRFVEGSNPLDALKSKTSFYFETM